MNATQALRSFLSDVMIQRLGWTILHSLWEGGAIALLLMCALAAMRRASARYIVACAALGAMIVAPGMTFTLLAPRASHATALAPRADVNRPGSTYLGPVPPIASSRNITASPSTPNPISSLLGYIVFTWCAGVAVLSLYHLAGWLTLQSLRRAPRFHAFDDAVTRIAGRLRLRRAVALVQSTFIDVPAVIGVFRPIVLVPIGILSDLSPQQVEALLAHELAHVRRHDYLVNLCQAAVETLMFFHPAAWWISRQIRVEREHCCDDVAADACGDRCAYAEALAALEMRRRAPVGRLALAADAGDLPGRVRRLLRAPAPRGGRRLPIRSLAAAMISIACAASPLVIGRQRLAIAADARDAKTQATSEPAGGAAAAKAEEPPVSPIEPADLVATKEDYKIGPNDSLSISITDLVAAGVETVKSVRVSETGSVSLPLVGVIKLAGLTSPEAEKAIAAAYRDKNLIANANVSVGIAEQRGSTFAIIGGVGRPGQYQITQSDFRILDAAALAGVKPGEVSEIRLIRGGSGGAGGDAKKRMLLIPMDKLLAGDLKFNVVIRPGDMLIAPEAEKKFVNVVVSHNGITLEGATTDFAHLRDTISAMPATERKRTVLAVSAATPDVTVERFFNATGELSRIVQDLGLAHLSQTGIQKPDAKAAAAAAPNPDQLETGEYYIDGIVKRTGVYSLTARKITLKQALAAAGGIEGQGDGFISVLRRGKTEENLVLENAKVSDLLSGKQRDLYLHANDIVRVTQTPENRPATQPAPLP